jgi:hypothetical protein
MKDQRTTSKLEVKFYAALTDRAVILEAFDDPSVRDNAANDDAILRLIDGYTARVMRSYEAVRETVVSLSSQKEVW